MTIYEQIAEIRPVVMVRDANQIVQRTINGTYAHKINNVLIWFFSLDKPLSNGGNCIRVRDLVEIVS